MLDTMIKLLIARGQTDGLAEKLDVFYVMGRLSGEQYAELMAALGQPGV